VQTAVWVPEDDRAFAARLAWYGARLAWYCARNPVALERLTSDRAARVVRDRSDRSEGPTAGTETVDPLEFLARVLVHIPDDGHVTTRRCGWYSYQGRLDQAPRVDLPRPTRKAVLPRRTRLCNVVLAERMIRPFCHVAACRISELP